MLQKKRWKAVQDALVFDNIEEVNKHVEKLDMYHGPLSQTCETALQFGATKSLEALLQAGNGFYSFEEKRQEKALRLVEQATAAADPLPLLLVLKKANTEFTYSTYRLPEESFFLQNTPVGFIQACLEENPSLFGACVRNTGLHDTEKLKFILAFSSRAPHAKTILSAALTETAKTGDVEKAELLIARGADPSHASAQPLLRAAEAGHKDMVDLLLPLTDLDTHGKDLLTQLEQKGIARGVLESIRAAVDNPLRGEEADSADLADDTADYALVDEDTLSRQQKLPDGDVLTTIFNFQTQQEQLILKSPQSQPALYAVSFDQVDKDVIAAMREKLNELKKQAPRL
jgi:hypothetical protein